MAEAENEVRNENVEATSSPPEAEPAKVEAEKTKETANEEKAENVSEATPEKVKENKTGVVLIVGGEDNRTKVMAKKIKPLSEDELKSALEDVEEFEENLDNNLTMAELTEKLMQKNPNKETFLTPKEMKKQFSNGRMFNPNGIELTVDEKAKDRESYELIRSSLNQRTFLKGTVKTITIEKDESGRENVFANIFLGSYVIKIPVSEFMWVNGLQSNIAPRPTVQLLESYMARRIGTEVEFFVTSFDAREKIAYATRLEALGLVGFANYVKQDKKLNRPRIVVGTKVPATVVAVTSSFAICEAYGAEFTLKDDELEWGGVTNVNENYKVGDVFLVQIKEVIPEVVEMGKKKDGSDRFIKKVNVIASKKDLIKNPFDSFEKNFEVGTRVNAECTSVSREFGCRYTIDTPYGNLTKVFSDFPSHMPVYNIPRHGDICDVVIKRKNNDKQLIEVAFREVITRKEDRRR